jgi:hypothetical protein
MNSAAAQVASSMPTATSPWSDNAHPSARAPWMSPSCVRKMFRPVAEQAGVIAKAAKHPAGTVWAEWRVGVAHHYLGNQAAAQLHLERGMTLAVELGVFNANFFGLDPRIFALSCLARTLWLRGFSDQALRIARKAIDEAASRDHPVPICGSLLHAPMLLLWTGDCRAPATSSSS